MLAVTDSAATVEQDYRQLCAGCHGYSLEGNDAPALNTGTYLNVDREQDLVGLIRDGLIDKGMPAFGNALDDGRIRALVILIREASANKAGGRKEPPTPKTIHRVAVGDDAFDNVLGSFDDALAMLKSGWHASGDFASPASAASWTGTARYFNPDVAVIGLNALSTCEMNGNAKGCDRSIGTLTSPEFMIDRGRPHLNMLMAGGNGSVNVGLRVLDANDAIVIERKPDSCAPSHIDGNDDWVSIDLSPHIGERLRVQIFDESDQGCGFISVDQLHLSAKPALARIAVEDMPAEGIVDTDQHGVHFRTVATFDGLFWALEECNDNSLLLTERAGKLWHHHPAKGLTLVADTPDVWSEGQGGLLDVALNPGSDCSDWVYLAYSAELKPGSNRGMTTIARGKIENGRWARQQVLYAADDDYHTSSSINFGSRIVLRDGFLYFTVGDRGVMNHAQDTNRPNGKIHRLHNDGRVPDDNPFGNSVWTLGNRNPQGMTMHPVTHELYEAEHGPRGGDEINLIVRGRNYGWPEVTHGMDYDGTPITAYTEKPGMEPPLHHWTPSIAVSAITFCEGDVFANWNGDMLAASLAKEELHRLRFQDGRLLQQELLLKGLGRIRDVITARSGRIYLLVESGTRTTSRIIELSNADEQQ
jgi:glucose/arabinose dehydrogenase